MTDIWNVPKGCYAVSIHIKLADTDDNMKPTKHKHILLFMQKDVPEEYISHEVEVRTTRMMESLWKEAEEEKEKK